VRSLLLAGASLRVAVAAVFLIDTTLPEAAAATAAGAALMAIAAPAVAAEPEAPVEGFSAEQLDAMLAPIALYPDDLLTQTLMAATFPVDVVSAHRWLNEGNNRSLTGPALESALQTQPWDPSVKSLVPFPQLLDNLNSHLDWTQQLGYAMQVQEPEVFASVQRLRARAQQAGHLASNQQINVRTEPLPPAPAGAPPPPPDWPTQTIIIEPANPQVVYVPVYDPTAVFGGWTYALPPVYFPPPPGAALAAGLWWGAGVAITAGLWGWARPSWGCCWGRWGGWGRTNVNINVNRWNNISGGRRRWNGNANGSWRPNAPNRRPGGGFNRPGGPVGSPNRPVTPPAGGFPNRPGAGQGGRPNRGERPATGPGGRPGRVERPATGQGGRPGRGERPSVGRGAGAQRPEGGRRPGGGQRPGVGQRPAGQPPALPGNGGGFNQRGNRGMGARPGGAQGGRQFQGRGGGGGGPGGARGGGGNRGGGGGGGPGRRGN
jgi:hypothetical protein